MNETPAQPAADSAASAASQRLLSLDALRGADMFWIMGGEGIAHAAAKLTGWAWLVWLSGQLEHPEWNGFAFYDLIFPLFLFMAGASMPFSYEKRLAAGDSKWDLYKHAIIRGLTLVFLGMVYNGLLRFNFANQRYPSVLGRIGLAYMFAALIFLNTNVRGRVLWIVGLLVGYWAALKFIPVPGYGAGDLAPGHTLTDYIDRLLIPGKLYKNIRLPEGGFQNIRDPEGLFATVPAIATCLAGVLTGSLLKNPRFTGYYKTAAMIITGVISLGAAWLWNFNFPINKNLWTSSFVLHCAGWSLIFLSLFYLVIDVWKFRAWAFFFIVIGSNSILIYLLPEIIDFDRASNFFFGGAIKLASKDYRELLGATAYVLTEWLLLYFIYRKKIFLRV